MQNKSVNIAFKERSAQFHGTRELVDALQKAILSDAQPYDVEQLYTWTAGSMRRDVDRYVDAKKLAEMRA